MKSTITLNLYYSPIMRKFRTLCHITEFCSHLYIFIIVLEDIILTLCCFVQQHFVQHE